MSKKDLDVEEFFSDPKFSKDAEFMRKAVNKVLDDRISEERKKKPKQLSFFDRMFSLGSDKDDEDDGGDKDE